VKAPYPDTPATQIILQQKGSISDGEVTVCPQPATYQLNWQTCNSVTMELLQDTCSNRLLSNGTQLVRLDIEAGECPEINTARSTYITSTVLLFIVGFFLV